MKIGVIGAGTMGQGIAKAFAQVEGNTVALCDIKQEWAENGLAKIKKGYEKLVAKGKMTQEKADAIVAAITPGLKEDLCADCDLIVEAAFEDMKVKQTTFGELDAICKPECIFASNTSSLSITEIGKNVKRPVVGMHFFNPADRMKLIEVIAGCNTPAETVEKIKEISVAIGKSPVQVNEAAGFVVNRILIPMINEAAFIKMEGVSDIAGSIDHSLIHHQPAVAAGLCDLGCGDHVTGAHFVDEALALGVDQHSAVAAQALGDQGSGVGFHGGVDLDLIHIHGVGTDGGCHLNALALSASGIGGHEALQLRL